MLTNINWQVPDKEFMVRLRFLCSMERTLKLDPAFKRLVQIGPHGQIVHTSAQVWIDEYGNAFYIESHEGSGAW